MTQNTRPEHQNEPRWIKSARVLAALLLVGLVAAPISLSAQDIMEWARNGLGLGSFWPWIVFYALDATAAISVLICVHSAWNAERAVPFQLMVWTIAGISAFAQYNHGKEIKDHAPDAYWFFPVMALVAPVMLELVLAKLRAWQRSRLGQTAVQLPKFGVLRWVPGIGSFEETYGAWRVARLLNIPTYEGAVSMYRTLCPNGGMRVLKAVRNYQDSKRNISVPRSNWVRQAEPEQVTTVIPERRRIELGTDPDRTYVLAIRNDPSFPEVTISTIQEIVCKIDPTGKCGKTRAIRLRDKAKEQSK